MIRSAESRLEGFAEDLGRLLGTAKAKADSWLEQRKSIANQLSSISETATDLLRQLTGGGARAVAARRGRRAGGRRRQPGRPKGGGRKRRRMSAEARARIAEAQRRRWAKHRREQKKNSA